MRLRLSMSYVDETIVVSASGGIDLITATQLWAYVMDKFEQGHSRIVLDLSGVGSMDCSGVSALVTISKRVTADRGSLRLVAPGPPAQRVLRATRMDEHLCIYDSRDDAIAGESRTTPLLAQQRD